MICVILYNKKRIPRSSHNFFFFFGFQWVQGIKKSTHKKGKSGRGKGDGARGRGELEKKSRSSFEIYAPMASHFASVRKFFKQNSILRPPQLTLSLRKSSSTRSNHSTSPHPPHPPTPPVQHSTPLREREGGCCGPVGLIKSRFTLILIHAKPFLPFVFSLIYAANTQREEEREGEIGG